MLDHRQPAEAVLEIALMLWFRVAVLWIGIFLGLPLGKNEGGPRRCGSWSSQPGSCRTPSSPRSSCHPGWSPWPPGTQCRDLHVYERPGWKISTDGDSVLTASDTVTSSVVVQ